MLQIAVVGFGNVGRCAFEAVQGAPDMEVRCIVGSPRRPPAPGLEHLWAKDIKDIQAHGKIDTAILCLPSRQCPDAAETLLGMGIPTADSFDIHGDIWDLKCRLDPVAKQSGAACVIAAGWDPGTDSITRALMEAMAPRGITFTNFGPGMSMGHTVAAKAVEGVKDALSLTLPAGAGAHRRAVYVRLEPGASFEDVKRAIKTDAYFIHDETVVREVDDVAALMDVGHGVHIARKGVAGATHNQQLEYSMRVNGPALTGQVLACAARAVVKCPPGCYTLIEIPVIDMLPGETEDLIRRLV